VELLEILIINFRENSWAVYCIRHLLVCMLVEGGHRAIIFSRIGGVQQDIYREGLHFRYCSLWKFCCFDAVASI